MFNYNRVIVCYFLWAYFVDLLGININEYLAGLLVLHKLNGVRDEQYAHEEHREQRH